MSSHQPLVALAIQSFGRESEYKRAIVTILSYYAYSSIKKEESEVILFTDDPAYFKEYLQDIPVRFVLLTPEKIKEMRGQYDFLHRMKIALIEESFGMTQGKLLYADSDTFFIADPASFAARINPEQAFMHLLEYPFVADTEDKTITYYQFHQLISKKEFILTDGTSFKVTPDYASWNAGVMFFDHSHARLLPDVYKLTDQFFPESNSHASEQYAFSVVLQKNIRLAACDTVIYHYWYRTKKQIMDAFLAEQLDEAWSKKALKEKISEVREWTKILPEYFEEHLWMVKDNAIQAFNKNMFAEGYRWTIKAMIKSPFQSGSLLKDTLYHLKRQITQKH